MSFLLQRPAGRGLSLTQIDAPVLRIGRGTNQELRSENPAVALAHAIIESDAAGYLITDKGSITGTYVNRKPVETSRLAKGDVLEIGDLRIEVQLADPAKPLFLRVATARAPVSATFDEEEEEAEAATPAATPGKRVVKPKKIDYVAAYRLRRPYLTKLSLTALLLIVALAIVGEVILPARQRTFMPGSVSADHARATAHRCDACHTPWNSVTNQKCVDCHPQQQQPHAMFEAKTPDCFSCHAEHRGATKLSAIGERFCEDCHADLRPHVKAMNADIQRIARIPGFGNGHPGFVWPSDTNKLFFNHKLHLSKNGVFNEKGRREVLQCASCHALRDDNEPAPVDYEANCQRCHRLTFNPRFPTAEVPHGGDPGIVYGYVAITYSGNRDLIGKPADVVRRLLAQRKGVAVDALVKFHADQVVKTKCQKCHDVLRRGEQLAVAPPVIRTQWRAGSSFTHSNPQHRACETCHAGARESVSTGDVLLPQRDNCVTCHASDAAKRQAASKCTTCHEYHHRPQLVAASLAPVAGVGGLGSGGRMLQGILLALIVILLLVVLVPVGIALFQRLRPERASAPPQRSTPPAPKPPPVMQDIPTAKVVPPPEVTVAKVPPPPAIDVTRVDMPLPQAPKQESGGTEMVQWYGMLHCTVGPLEGQRFVIEEGGFWIGRDANLAKVVIPDSRVSKRHVRIVPRDGRVWAIDEGSTNGTFLAGGGGQRITEVQLKRGDTLILGDNAATFVYQI